ncbi:hypothetical protein IJZ97_02645 [bacterium]|nr:hypothetical protein [bacterium]
MVKINTRRRNLQRAMQQIINQDEVKPKKIKFDLKSSYKINEADNVSADTFTKRMIDDLDLPQYKEYAPWSVVYRNPSSTIVMTKS